MKRMMSTMAALLAALPAVASAQVAEPPKTVRPDQLAFRDLYKELVEINTTLSAGSCTAAAEAMGARLKAAGYPADDVKVVVAEGHPKEGSLVAVLRGGDAKSKPMLLLAHIDVVEANRADWTRDPFKLVEENGYFFGRGTSDDKAQAAIWVDSLIRLKQSGFKPKRDIKMALTCGEESSGAYNGIEDLVKNHRALVDAEFALNEGAGGLLDERGQPMILEVQAGEKVYQDFTLTVTNPGGHSSRPGPTNAIYQLSAALSNIGAYAFPPRLIDATRGYFVQMQPRVTAEQAAAMKALVASINDAAALKTVSADPMWNSMLRTTCVATLLSGGHAPNALPQRATANVNCRILPGTPVEEVKAKLADLAGPAVTVTLAEAPGPQSPPPSLTPAIMGPIEKQAAKLWPGVPIVPTMATGASDAIYTNAGGIPTYGVSGLFEGPDMGNIHGLNEHMRVKSLYEGRDFLYGLIKDYAGGK